MGAGGTIGLESAGRAVNEGICAAAGGSLSRFVYQAGHAGEGPSKASSGARSKPLLKHRSRSRLGREWDGQTLGRDSCSGNGV